MAISLVVDAKAVEISRCKIEHYGGLSRFPFVIANNINREFASLSLDFNLCPQMLGLFILTADPC